MIELLSRIPVLSLLIFLPLLLAALLYLLPFFSPSRDENGERVRIASSIVALGIFILSLLMAVAFDGTSGGLQFEERHAWIPSFGITYNVGVDGISLFLVLLTTFLMPLVFFASGSIKSLRRGYIASMLVLQTAMTGTLLALDLFLFYVFWELMLAPMYFIIGIWGGQKRFYATLKFVLYTVFGSLLMLVALLYVAWVYYQQYGVPSFNLSDILGKAYFTRREELWLFAGLALAFAVKIPLFPLHTWLPDAHVEAPTGGSVILAGVLLKMGLYGLIRFAWPLFPRAAETCGPLLAVLAVTGIVYGALVAWAQADMKKLVAYSSVSHLGFCVLGFASLSVAAISGSIYQMLNHGISTGALFFIVGVLYDRKHTRLIADYGGLASKVPVFAFFFLVFLLSSIALPGTNGFVGEFLILSGSFGTYPGLTIFALLGVILGAVYMLTLYMKTMYGDFNAEKNSDLTDVNKTETAVFVPLLVLVFFMGLYPQPILRRIEPAAGAYIEAIGERKEMLQAGEGATALELRLMKPLGFGGEKG